LSSGSLLARPWTGGADRLSGLRLDELLEDKRHRLAHDVDAAPGADGVDQ
jgi:hypothetical protein